MGSIISSYHAFEEQFKEAGFLESKDQRLEALKRYFEKGGVISIASGSSASWPKLSYPSKKRIQQQILEAKKFRQLFGQKRSDWRKEFRDATYSNLKKSAKKFADKLYWRHLAKKLTDKDYRSDADSVKLPTEMVSDQRYRPMIEMFVNDLDYRKQLSETVKTSVVYKSNKLARHALEVNELKKGISNEQIKDIEKKIVEIDKDLAMLNAMLKWAK